MTHADVLSDCVLFIFGSHLLFPQVPLGRLTSYGCLREEWYVDGERGRGYDYLPSCEAIDCVAQIFSAVGSPSRKESYSNPPCSPPLDPLFQVASGASISSTSMYVDECDLMILKMATHKKKKRTVFLMQGSWVLGVR